MKRLAILLVALTMVFSVTAIPGIGMAGEDIGKPVICKAEKEMNPVCCRRGAPDKSEQMSSPSFEMDDYTARLYMETSF